MLAADFLRSRGRLRLLALVLLAAGIVDGSAQRRAELGYTNAVSERLIEAFSRRFGSGAAPRINAWKGYAERRRTSRLEELELLKEVNVTLNRLPFVDDAKHWGEADYWATPAESQASNGGDCEDYSIAKYFLLKELGIANAKLRITYVKAVKLDQAHMVLAYYPQPDAEPLVLDNLEDTVRPASQRSDLVPVYTFNDEEVWVAGKKGASRQIRNWNALVQRLEQELRT